MPSQTFKATRTHNRKFPGKLGPRPDRYQARLEDADDRRKERAGRTPLEQLARLDAAFGPGLGAKRERTRLAKSLKPSGKGGK